MPSKILVLEEKLVLRDAIKSVIRILFTRSLPVIESDNCDAAVELLASHSDVDLLVSRPQALSGDHGSRLLSATQALRLPILIVPAGDEYDVFIKAISFGIKGYLSGKGQLGALVDALAEAVCQSGLLDASVAAGRTSVGMGSRRGTENRQPRVHNLAKPTLRHALSPRQSEVLQLLTAGRSSKEIAKQLRIAEGTVKTQIKTIFRALGARNRTEAVMLVIQPESFGPRATLP